MKATFRKVKEVKFRNLKKVNCKAKEHRILRILTKQAFQGRSFLNKFPKTKQSFKVEVHKYLKTHRTLFAIVLAN